MRPRQFSQLKNALHCFIFELIYFMCFSKTVITGQREQNRVCYSPHHHHHPWGISSDLSMLMKAVWPSSLLRISMNVLMDSAEPGHSLKSDGKWATPKTKLQARNSNVRSACHHVPYINVFILIKSQGRNSVWKSMDFKSMLRGHAHLFLEWATKSSLAFRVPQLTYSFNQLPSQTSIQREIPSLPSLWAQPPLQSLPPTLLRFRPVKTNFQISLA